MNALNARILSVSAKVAFNMYCVVCQPAKPWLVVRTCAEPGIKADDLGQIDMDFVAVKVHCVAVVYQGWEGGAQVDVQHLAVSYIV